MFEIEFLRKPCLRFWLCLELYLPPLFVFLSVNSSTFGAAARVRECGQRAASLRNWKTEAALVISLQCFVCTFSTARGGPFLFFSPARSHFLCTLMIHGSFFGPWAHIFYERVRGLVAVHWHRRQPIGMANLLRAKAVDRSHTILENERLSLFSYKHFVRQKVQIKCFRKWPMCESEIYVVGRQDETRTKEGVFCRMKVIIRFVRLFYAVFLIPRNVFCISLMQTSIDK